VAKAEMTTVICNASGHPAPAIAWYKVTDQGWTAINSFPIHKTETELFIRLQLASEQLEKVSGQAELRIMLDKSSSNVYECQANNGIGSTIKKKIWIRFQGIQQITSG
jgi:hypothetical protein